MTSITSTRVIVPIPFLFMTSYLQKQISITLSCFVFKANSTLNKEAYHGQSHRALTLVLFCFSIKSLFKLKTDRKRDKNQLWKHQLQEVLQRRDENRGIIEKARLKIDVEKWSNKWKRFSLSSSDRLKSYSFGKDKDPVYLHFKAAHRRIQGVKGQLHNFGYTLQVTY